MKKILSLMLAIGMVSTASAFTFSFNQSSPDTQAFLTSGSFDIDYRLTTLVTSSSTQIHTDKLKAGGIPATELNSLLKLVNDLLTNHPGQFINLPGEEPTHVLFTLKCANGASVPYTANDLDLLNGNGAFEMQPPAGCG